MKKSNVLKKCIFFSVLCILLLLVVTIMLRYDVEGEKALPFSIQKILLVSTVDGNKIDDPENLWNIDVTQVNDVYIYIQQENAEKDMTIDHIDLQNFVVSQAPQKGELQLLRPTGEWNNLYTLSQQNYLTEGLTYLGGTIDDMKSLEIGNKGGVLGFRLAVSNLGSYVSNDNTEIIYDGRLLSNLGVAEPEVQFAINFDIIIETSDHIAYKGNIQLEMPIKGVIEQGSTSMEITDFSKVVFKRI